MNKYAVYSEDNKLIGYETLSEDGRWTFILENEDFERLGTISPSFEEKLTRHKFIEKIDTHGSQIYANSSVVVFTFLDNKLREHEVIGYFYFNDTDLGYWIEMIDQADVKYNHTRFYANRVKDLKIIDTLQENKLGLIGDKDENTK